MTQNKETNHTVLRHLSGSASIEVQCKPLDQYITFALMDGVYNTSDVFLTAQDLYSIMDVCRDALAIIGDAR